MFEVLLLNYKLTNYSFMYLCHTVSKFVKLISVLQVLTIFVLRTFGIVSIMLKYTLVFTVFPEYLVLKATRNNL